MSDHVFHTIDTYQRYSYTVYQATGGFIAGSY